jgi:hypothetical protein
MWRQLGFSPPGGPKTLTYVVLAPADCTAVAAAYMKVGGTTGYLGLGLRVGGSGPKP